MGFLKILLFISLLQVLLVQASASVTKNNLFYVDGESGTVTLGNL